jgi:hypothetical protein
MQKSANWMPCHGLRCGWHGVQSISGLGPLDTLESVIFPGAGASGEKSGNGMRVGGLLKNAGDSKIGGYVSWASSVTSQHNIPRSSLNTSGSDSGGYTDLLRLRPREARRRSSSTPGLSWRRGGGLLQLRACPPNPQWRSQMAEVFHHALWLLLFV